MGYVTGPRISEIEYVNNVEVIDRFRIQFGQIILGTNKRDKFDASEHLWQIQQRG
jgi:hypothetical protein